MRIKLAAGALALMAGLGACGGDSYNRDDAIEQLTDEGVTKEVATCIVDAVEDEFGIETLNANREPTAEEEAKIGEISLGCMTEG
jgi:hypothetical protein